MVKIAPVGEVYVWSRQSSNKHNDTSKIRDKRVNKADPPKPTGKWFEGKEIR